MNKELRIGEHDSHLFFKTKLSTSRDCAAANIMMDGRPLYPHDHHPLRQDYSTDAIYEVHPLARIDHPVRYYFIDFELSVRIPEGSSPMVLGRAGRDKSIPELSFDVPYDAFKADIYALGNMYDKEFLLVCMSYQFSLLLDLKWDL